MDQLAYGPLEELGLQVLIDGDRGGPVGWLVLMAAPV
jgi:hypothetical protein